ncbi:hypothetical protein GCG54_00015389 [Colletotrichum gloeosporioides]|uniref:Uncharacterized protein n=1 Tax=Colletotrichum gloeosporioides TaxID=474922 RepID=A0A8H4FKN7_COLGL|nr:uncharacterized protein GCG54_00015389 [Colletotrichum gloeosporioides]KAF3805833.1 hypothetical protein GCG54_00015389 [Colletotrichum gloeosporioides]
MLWTDYWTRFNTISIPIQDEDAFFADAMAAARVAENRQHLEEILEQKSRERRAELADVVSSIAIAAISLRTPFDTPTARSAALKVGQTGSLDSFAQLACGVAFSWTGANQKAERVNIEPRENRAPSAEARAQSKNDTDNDSDGDADEDTHDTHDTHDTPEDDYEEAYMPTNDPWELENAFPSDYDIYEAAAGDECGSEYHGCDPLRAL